jgi:PAS domain-containing protein
LILFALGLELTMLLAVVLLVGIWQRSRTTGERVNAILLCAACVAWALGELVLLRELTGEHVADRIKYLGVLVLPPAWFGFAAHAADLPVARRAPWFTSLLLVPSALFYAVLCSESHGHLFLTTVPGGSDAHGPLWLLSAVYAQALVVSGSAVLVATAWRWSRPREKVQRLIVALVPVVPLVGNALYITIGADWPCDPTPILQAVVILALYGAVFFGGLLDSLPLSQRDLVHQLPFGVVIADRLGRVIEINEVATARLGIFENSVLGASFDDVLGDIPTERVRPLRRAGRLCGRIALI